MQQQEPRQCAAQRGIESRIAISVLSAQADVVLVMGDDRLYNQLKNHYRERVSTHSMHHPDAMADACRDGSLLRHPSLPAPCAKHLCRALHVAPAIYPPRNLLDPCEGDSFVKTQSTPSRSTPCLKMVSGESKAVFPSIFEVLNACLMQILEFSLQNKTGVEVVKLPKSGGVVTRSPAVRKAARVRRVREYFYGPRGDLLPHVVELAFDEASIFRVGGKPRADASSLPIGEARALALDHRVSTKHLALLALSSVVPTEAPAPPACSPLSAVALPGHPCLAVPQPHSWLRRVYPLPRSYSDLSWMRFLWPCINFA